MKRFFAFVLSLSLLLGISSCGKGEFDYITSDITDYYDVLLSEFTGGVYDIDIPDEITEEDVWRELRYLQLYHAQHNGGDSLDAYVNAPALGDVPFFYYDVALTPDGEGVFSNIFTQDGAANVTIGYWEFPNAKVDKANPLFDNKTFQDALMETVPASRVKEGVVEKGDIVCIDYVFINEKNVSDASVTNVRIDTSDLSMYASIHPEKMLSDLVGKTLGEQYTVTHTFTPEGATEEITYTYKYKVKHKLQEEYKTVAVSLSEDAFDDSYNDVLQAMNGKTVYIRYAIARYVDFDLPTLNADFYLDVIGVVTEETELQKIEQETIAQMKAQMEKERLLKKVYPLVHDAVFARILAREDRVKKLPQNKVEQTYKNLAKKVQQAYDSEKYDIGFSYKNVDEYAASYFGYDADEYKSLEAVCRAEAKLEVELRLFAFAIAQLGGIRMTPEQRDVYYVLYLEQQIASFTDPTSPYSVTLTDEERAMIYREEGESEINRLYAELLNLVIKFYATYQGVTMTMEQAIAFVGEKDVILFEALVQVVEVNVREYLYENNTWNDTTP
ncbi:MAG: hypothetical protein E7609_01875 [Ruminococcaceae bacterium]|nr:hypothetical protein [Oscillospiraceae bacterium]